MIVTSLDEAIEAELAGADRLELVCSLESGGFTPPLMLVQKVIERVSIPVRVMLRENASMSIGDEAELDTLRYSATRFADLPIDGLVLGFTNDDSVDLSATKELLSEAPNHRVTFHRAFDHVRNPLCALQELKQFPQIDRILTSGGKGSWIKRKRRLLEWQRAAAPEMKIIVAAGLCAANLAATSEDFNEIEVHVGRAARNPQATSGTVSRHRIASLKRLLG
ncbi:MAG: copper homeostasis protein CutC [Bryobacteraceae bacterium]